MMFYKASGFQNRKDVGRLRMPSTFGHGHADRLQSFPSRGIKPASKGTPPFHRYPPPYFGRLRADSDVKTTRSQAIHRHPDEELMIVNFPVAAEDSDLSPREPHRRHKTLLGSLIHEASRRCIDLDPRESMQIMAFVSQALEATAPVVPVIGGISVVNLGSWLGSNHYASRQHRRPISGKAAAERGDRCLKMPST
jgi:hypothetical protein